MPLRFSAVVLVLLGAAFSLSVRADSPKHVQVVQTFEPARDNGTPLVQVRFSNTAIGTFLIDTGEYESVITDKFAKKADFKPEAYRTVWLWFGLPLLNYVEAPKIQLENLTVLKPTFHVVSQDFLFQMDGRQIDGILGGDFLSRFALRIDYPAHEIGWITPGNLSSQDVAAMGFTAQNYVELGQERSRSNSKVNHYSVRADFLNGDHEASEDLWIDTGAPDTLVSTPLAEQLSLRPLKTINIETLSNPMSPADRCAAGQIQIGQMTLSNVSVLVPQQKDSDFPSLLGENVLSDCVVLLDFGPHKFYLRPVLPPAKPELPLDKTQIVWDRLRAAPDLPTVEEMLAAGFAPDAQETLAEQAARLRDPLADSGKDAERLEKLGAVLHAGEDQAGAKAAFAQAAVQAAASRKAHPADIPAAQRWVDALLDAGHYDEAIAAATQTTVWEPASASAWRLLGSVLTTRAASVLLGRREKLTPDKALKIEDRLPGTPPDAAEAALLLRLLVQAHAALDKSVALAPSDPEGYSDRAFFHLVSRASLSVLQEAGIKIDLPASDVPSVETALAEALSDWQQRTALSPADPDALAVAGIVDQQMPFFHDRLWLTKHLKGTKCTLPETLTTTEIAQSRLTLLTQGKDKAAVVSAWTALGKVQAGNTEAAAEKSWHQALALDPAHTEALALLVSYLYHADRWKDLQDLLTQQCASCDSVPLRLMQASVLSGEGQSAEAETQVRAALSLAPGNAAANLMLADLLLARSGTDPAALTEAKSCLSTARLGYGSLATARQKATLITSEAVWLALDHDPAGAEQQLVDLARAQPNCTEVREALAALVPY